MGRTVRRRRPKPKPAGPEPEQLDIEDELKQEHMEEFGWKVPHHSDCTGAPRLDHACVNPRCSYRGEDETPREQPTIEELLQKLYMTETDAMHGQGVIEVLESKVSVLEDLVVRLVSERDRQEPVTEDDVPF